jgi:uncharacterized membrane protein
MILVLFGILVIWIFYLQNRIGELERRLSDTKQLIAHTRPTVSSHEAKRPTESTIQEAPAFFEAKTEPVSHLEVTTIETQDNRFVMWLKEDFLVKLGAFLLLIAFGWFVSYAFAKDWIGPIGRIALGLAFGIGFLGFGSTRIRSFAQQGGIFLALGSTIILLTIWAARELYQFFTPLIALVVMFLSVLFVSVQAYIYDRRSLAIASLLLAAAAPLFTNSPEPSIVGLYSYLVLITAGTLWIVFAKGWSILSPLALIIVSYFSIPFWMYAISSQEGLVGLFFAFLFVLLFFSSNIASMLYRREGNLDKAHLLTAIGTGIYLCAWILTVMSDSWVSLTLAAWALVFALGAQLFYRYASRPEPFYIYGSVSIAYIGMATIFELSGPVLLVALASEIALLTIVSSIIIRKEEVTASLAALLGLPFFLSFDVLSRYVLSGEA